MRFDNRSRVSTYLSGWMPTGDETNPPTAVDYLVVAGGGGQTSIGLSGGGGGGGGVRSTVQATGGGGSLESALAVTAGPIYIRFLNTDTVLELVFATARSGLPSPSKSPVETH